jgi:hypothetical protein
MSEAKTICQTPTPGNKPTPIPSWKYDLIRDAILSVVPSRAPGIAFKELPSLVAGQLSSAQQAELGSVSWHTTTVKLDLEVKGEISRVPGVSPQHLVRSS